MLYVAFVCTPCCILMRVVGKFETGQTSEPTTPNTSFVFKKLKRSTMHPFAQFIQHCWDLARALHMVSMEMHNTSHYTLRVCVRFIYLTVPFWYASAAYQASLVEPWFVFWRDAVEPKYPWRDQTSLICRRSVPKRYY